MTHLATRATAARLARALQARALEIATRRRKDADRLARMNGFIDADDEAQSAPRAQSVEASALGNWTR